MDNLRLALTSASGHGSSESLIRLAVALSRFWNVRGFWAEGRRWLEAAIAAHPDGPPALRSKALAAAALMCERQGNFQAAISFGEKALALARTAGDHATAAEALDSLSSAAQEQGEAARAAALLDECLAEWRASGSVRGVVSSVAGALGEVGWGAVRRGDYEEAHALFHEALAVASELGIARARSYALLGLASVAVTTGRLEDARSFLDEATSISQRLGDTRFLGREAYMRARLAWNEGDLDVADAEFQEALRSASARGEQILLTMALEGLARVAQAHHDADRAATLLGAAAHIRDTLPWPVPSAERPLYDATLSDVRDALGPTSFETAWARGIGMPPEAAVRIALDGAPTMTVPG
jgi:tetratricopeptide (TPR) repeat protein